MAKKNEITKLKRGVGNFNLIGKAKIREYTFRLDQESSRADSDWIYNQLNLGVDCGTQYGVIYCDLMGGYGTDRENKILVHGKKENENKVMIDDFENRFEVNWDDRFEEEILESVGDMAFITVGLEKGEKDKVIYKKFLSAYDAVEYINEVLEEDMVLNVRGNLKWSVYNDEPQIRKEITSIVLSKATEDKFKATFNQTIFLSKDAIGKIDKDNLTIPIECRVVDYFKTYNDIEVKTLLPIYKTFDLKIDISNKDKANKIIEMFNVKKSKTITQMVVEGYFSKGDMVEIEISKDDFPDDIQELIDCGLMEEKDVLEKIAFANNGGNRKEKMYIKSPKIKFTGDDKKTPSLDKVVEAYREDDFDISLILESLNIKDVLDEALENDEEDLDAKDWLAGLD